MKVVTNTTSIWENFRNNLKKPMNKQINSINGYSSVQVKVQFYDFSA